ncbi:hypothetical protein A5747_04805 [Mycobacterium sp. IS-836]|nr:hypothetical protein A5747_04805 [Mycobacterium sp. IS-836]
MAAIVNQWIDPEGFLAVFVITEMIHLLSASARKGGGVMARVARTLKNLAISAWDATALSRVTLLMGP